MIFLSEEGGGECRCICCADRESMKKTLFFRFYAKKPGRAGKIIAKVNEDRRARMVADFGYRQYRFGENGNG